MYLHLGADKTVLVRDIVAIVNLESFSQYDELFNKWQDVVVLSKETPKSLIIMQKGKENISFLSPVSSLTILKRVNAYLDTLLGDI